MQNKFSGVKKAIRAGGGSQYSLAKLLEIDRQHVSNWTRRGIPAKHCKAVEKATGIPRAELRPDIFA